MEEKLFEYIIQLSFAVDCKAIVEELRTSNCWGCQHDRPSQKEHDCLMSVGMDPWFDYYDEALKRLDYKEVIQCARNVSLELGLTFNDDGWKTYLTEMKQCPIENVYLLAFEMEQSYTPQGRFEAVLKATSTYSITIES